jgi:hypothetical protein
MPFIMLNAFSAKTRKCEPLLVNAAFIVRAQRFEIGKGIRCWIQLAHEDDLVAVSESLEDVEDAIMSINDPEYSVHKKFGRMLSNKQSW